MLFNIILFTSCDTTDRNTWNLIRNENDMAHCKNSLPSMPHQRSTDLEALQIGMDGKRESKESILSAHLDDDWKKRKL